MSNSTAPIEVKTTYATTVNELPEAWSFVMERLETLGPNPRITISPIWSWNVVDAIDGVDQRPPRQFEVCVEGMIEEQA